MSDGEEANKSSGSLVVTLDEEEGNPLSSVLDGAVGGAPVEPSGGGMEITAEVKQRHKEINKLFDKFEETCPRSKLNKTRMFCEATGEKQGN